MGWYCLTFETGKISTDILVSCENTETGDVYKNKINLDYNSAVTDRNSLVEYLFSQNTNIKISTNTQGKLIISAGRFLCGNLDDCLDCDEKYGECICDDDYKYNEVRDIMVIALYKMPILDDISKEKSENIDNYDKKTCDQIEQSEKVSNDIESDVIPFVTVISETYDFDIQSDMINMYSILPKKIENEAVRICKEKYGIKNAYEFDAVIMTGDNKKFVCFSLHDESGEEIEKYGCNFYLSINPKLCLGEQYKIYRILSPKLCGQISYLNNSFTTIIKNPEIYKFEFITNHDFAIFNDRIYKISNDYKNVYAGVLLKSLVTR